MDQGIHPLAAYRQKHKLTTAQLAAKIGDISPDAVRSWIGGRRMMSPKSRLRVCQVLRIPALQIVKHELALQAPKVD